LNSSLLGEKKSTTAATALPTMYICHITFLITIVRRIVVVVVVAAVMIVVPPAPVVACQLSQW